jgi:hypothetical protein
LGSAYGDYIFWDNTTAAWTVGSNKISIGQDAGKVSQAASAVAIGALAGNNGQGANAIAIGYSAGTTTQVAGAVAIGVYAGAGGQGANAISIGGINLPQAPQLPNTIILNASGTDITAPATTNGFYVTPLGSTGSATYDGTTIAGMFYDINAKEIKYNTTTKSFIIDHPLDSDNKYLVHACLEGPESGVYYRGKGEIVNGTSVEVQLPAYIGALCTDLTVQITHIYDGVVKAFSASEVDTATNTFTVHGENGRFNWLVHGKRGDVTVEPNKADVTVRGDGPYKYLV